MKKITLGLTAIVLSLTFAPNQSNATPLTANPGTVIETPVDKVKSEAMMLRLQEINAMDKSALSQSERKSLRKEVRSLKHEMKGNNDGVYLSVGAIIIIILLLILIL